jgi:hypothetical protein
MNLTREQPFFCWGVGGKSGKNQKPVKVISRWRSERA